MIYLIFYLQCPLHRVRPRSSSVERLDVLPPVDGLELQRGRAHPQQLTGRQHRPPRRGQPGCDPRPLERSTTTRQSPARSAPAPGRAPTPPTGPGGEALKASRPLSRSGARPIVMRPDSRSSTCRPRSFTSTCRVLLALSRRRLEPIASSPARGSGLTSPGPRKRSRDVACKGLLAIVQAIYHLKLAKTAVPSSVLCGPDPEPA